MGAGTTILAKVGNSMAQQSTTDQATTGDEKEVRSLVAQLESLNMKNLIIKAVGSTEPAKIEVLKDEKIAKRKEREQSEALKREQERKANVEAALQRLRAERAERQQQRKVSNAQNVNSNDSDDSNPPPPPIFTAIARETSAGSGGGSSPTTP